MSKEKAIELLELMRAPDVPMSRGEVMDLATEILAEIEVSGPTEFEQLQAENKQQAKELGRLKTITGLLCRGCDVEIKDELDGCRHTFCNQCLIKIEQALKEKNDL